MKELHLQFDWCDIILHNEISMTGGIVFTYIVKGDDTGNIIYPASTRPTSTVELDNYQAYELAMSILANIDVRETRGSC
tara:strand:- start:531 stop:767 length:237 start_codon:yes stop_codon:yes gene_type:complete